MPTVSVIIPTHNRSRLVCAALDSVLAQTYSDFEVIVVDDGSREDPFHVLACYEDPRVCVIHQENQGQGSARNTGILAAQGEYIAFLDSDDLWEPMKLEEQMGLFSRHKELVWVYSDAYAFDGVTNQKLYLFSKRSRQYEGDIAHKLFMHDFIGTSTVVVHRRVFKEVGLFTRIPKGQDWEMWLRIAARHHVRKTHSALTGYRIHRGMITQMQEPLFKFQCHVSVLENAVVFAPELYEPLQQQALATQCVYAGLSLLMQGDAQEARRMFWRGIHHSTSMLQAYPLLCATLLGDTVLKKLIQIYSRSSKKAL